MNDTNTIDQVLAVFQKDLALSSSEVSELVKTDVSLVTVKRYLGKLSKEGFLLQSGAGRSVKYTLTKKGVLLKSIDVEEYLRVEPDNRLANSRFQHDIFEPPFVQLFDKKELAQLDEATQIFRHRAKNIEASLREKELLRFIVEFSWKTSQIEGNTYDLLSTERLLLYGEKSSTNTEFEAQMILNQKRAIEFILEDTASWQQPSLPRIEKLHSFVADELGIAKNLRSSLVGITGTNYRPLENEFQIREAVVQLLTYIEGANNTYAKALLSVLGLSYIQPFVDGNKRTSRLLGNALLISHNLPPLSYRSVDDRTYKEATLLFYEQNTIVPFKKIFIDQYIFSSENYNFGYDS